MVSIRIIVIGAVIAAGLMMLQGNVVPAHGDDRFVPVVLGENEIGFNVSGNGHGHTYIALHHDESASVEAARQVIAEHGGLLVELIHPGGRNVTFAIGTELYEFDPNRIFSDIGIQDTLHEYGPYSSEAHAAVAKFAGQIKSLIGIHGLRDGLLVALHNNYNGGYSLKSYLPGGGEAAAAGAVVEVPGEDSDNFFLVTDAQLFGQLADAGFNVVLQSRRPPDDGSLSVYAESLGVRYVNVEAEDGNVSKQVQMIEALQ